MAEFSKPSKDGNKSSTTSKLNQILSIYNKIHEDNNYGSIIYELFDSVKEDLLEQLESRGIKSITAKWSKPKQSWASIPWIAFHDKNDEDKISNDVYGCFLFRHDMKGIYLTLRQTLTRYKKYPKPEQLSKLHRNNEYIRKKLNYLSAHGFSLDDAVDLKATLGSAEGHCNKATVLYKYYSRNSLPCDNDLVKDLQILVDACRVFNSQDTQQSEVGRAQVLSDMKTVSQTNIDEISFIEYLEQQGFVFDTSLIVSFLLSLKVKPFIILTGSSGCGKTKLAQLFAQYQVRSCGVKGRDYIVTDVKVGKSTNNKGWTFPRAPFFNYFPDLSKYQGQYEIEVDGIKGQGNLELPTRLFYQQNEAIKSRLDELASIDPTRRITLKIYIPTGKSSNYEIVPVGANWTESRHIVGFYNVITKEYQKTRALDLLLAAQEMKNQKVPFFLILDEMNLSHVERYFADFLSAIESGEAIPLHKGGVETDVPMDIVLPPNLMIIGTVNVDETTYMFSPKVLDRANTIEVRPGTMLDYLSGGTKHSEIWGEMRYLENVMEDALEIRSLNIGQIRVQFAGVEINGEAFWSVYSEEVTKFQQCLKEYGLDLGFRVVNEMSRFILAAWRFEGMPREWNNWRLYFDMQIKQKMLPRIHGSERSIGGLLEGMFQLCMTENILKAPRDYSNVEIGEKAIYKTSAIKLKEMDLMLYNQRYVSFTR